MNEKIAFAVLATALMMPAVTPSTQAAIGVEECPGTAKGGGFGDNAVSCTYTCDENSLLHIEVESTDEKVDIGGETSCGGSKAACVDNDGDCTGSTPVEQATTKADSAGECAAWSDEIWTDSLKVNCWSSVLPAPGLDEWCPVNVNPGPEVCLDPDPPIEGPVATCQHLTYDPSTKGRPVESPVAVKNCGVSSDVSFIRMEYVGGVVSGLKCSAMKCTPFEPIVELSPDRIRLVAT